MNIEHYCIIKKGYTVQQRRLQNASPKSQCLLRRSNKSQPMKEPQNETKRNETTDLKDQVQAAATCQRSHDTRTDTPRAHTPVLTLEVSLRWWLRVSLRRRIVHGLALWRITVALLTIHLLAVSLLGRKVSASSTSTVVVVGRATLRRRVGTGVVGGRRVRRWRVVL